jgi:hypothetical protein
MPPPLVDTSVWHAPKQEYSVRPMLTACGGFLLAVLWMDLMFDVQVLRYRSPARDLPEAVLASIAAYYRRVTTDAWPMNRAIGGVMVLAIVSLLVQLSRASAPRWLALLSLMLGGGAIAFVPRIFRNAVRLGTRADSAAEQSRLARAICRDHLLCLGGIAAFIVLQLLAATS